MKNTSFIRIFALICALFALTFSAYSCSGEGEITTGELLNTELPATEAPETEPPEREITVFSNDTTEYVIVRPEKTDDTSIYTAFRDNLGWSTKAKLNMDIDAFYKGHEYDENKAEILCGNVNYPEAKIGSEGLGLDEYRVSVIGNKIVISGKTEAALKAGLNAFSGYVGENIKDGNLIIKSSFLLNGEAKVSGFALLTDSLPAVEAYETAELSHCGDKYQQATLSGATAEGYAEYRAALESDGFALYAENEMAENTFSTYTKGELNVHTYFTPHNSEMRIIVSEKTVLPWTEDVTYTKVCEPTVTLMGLEKSGASGGLGMIIGLEDGSFVIIDGGNNNKIEADDLANTLKKLAPDPNNVLIRAWIFTHGHGDHVGAFKKFSQLYVRSKNFKIENFIYNFCDAASQRVHGGVSYTAAREGMQYWKDAVHHKALTGEVYRFPGCNIEVLYCMSDFIPQIIGEEKGIPDIDKESIDGNIETVVFRAEIAGQKFMITGDTSKVCVDEMCDRYGAYLKSDILQVPHHGHNSNRYRARNGTVEFYKLVDPSTVLWPSEMSGYTGRIEWDKKPGTKFEANYTLIFNLHVKKVIVAAATTTTITLPYNP